MTLDDLKRQRRWVLWRFILKPGKDKPDKVPFQVGGRMARTSAMRGPRVRSSGGPAPRLMLHGWLSCAMRDFRGPRYAEPSMSARGAPSDRSHACPKATYWCAMRCEIAASFSRLRDESNRNAH